MYSDPQPSSTATGWSAWELARLLLHWLAASASIVFIGSLFLLTRILPGETLPILVAAFSMLGIGLAGFCLWALAVGLPTVRRTFYGPSPVWPRDWSERAETPWFDRNGRMLWQHDGRGGWMRKVDVTTNMHGPTGQSTDND